MKSYAHFDITGLHYFSAVAEERSFSRASARLRIAQPAISRKIKALEQDLGVQLFTRHTRGVDLTEPGENLLRNAYALFRQIESLRDHAVTSGDTPRGVVTIGVLPTPGEYIVPRLVEQSRKLYPEIKFRIVEGYSGDLHSMLINQEINIAVMHAPMPHPDIIVHDLLVDYLCLVGKAGTLAKPSYTFAEAAGFPLILPDGPNLLRLHIDQIAQSRNIRLNISHLCNGFWLTKAMIRGGAGHTIVTFGSVVTDLERGDFDVALIGEPNVPWSLAVAMRVDQHRRLSLVVIKGLIETIVAELRSKRIWQQIPQATRLNGETQA
ncbi:LysR family transcriptional regulator [Mesorhizobium sp. 8]|uniref:LysR family transcriptional regulator n=1 Tax=Mesorhizobium sp. 8 TaxID=2584466 RepID=UPI00111DA512|nr:LysR family transcriptional regulator [Mesorhizobium sp. 8]QDC00702.1 LysR family transcriptional regulator [Mesorhizobium sp. 8]